MGYILQVTREPSDAITVYRRYLLLRPNDPEVLLRLGDCYVEVGEVEGARKTFLRLLEAETELSSVALERLEQIDTPWTKFLKNGKALGPAFARRCLDIHFHLSMLEEAASFPRDFGSIRRIGFSRYVTFLSQNFLRTGQYHFPRLPCDLCGSRRRSIAFLYLHHKIVRCADCGLEFVERKPPDGFDCEREFYEQAETIDFFESNWWHDPEHLEKRMEMLRDLFQEASLAFPCPGQRAFEIGCAEGQVLDYLKQAGYAVSGLEASKELVSFARDKFGIEVHHTTVSAFEPEGTGWDLVLSYHVMEHLDKPSVLLEKARALLKPGGHLVIEVPVPDLHELPLTDKLDPKAGYACLGHMHFFTRETMEKYLARFRFRLLASYTYPTRCCMGDSWRSRRGDGCLPVGSAREQ